MAWNNQNVLKDNLRDLLIQNDMTIGELSKKTGIQKQTISNYLHVDNIEPSAYKLLRIADVFGVSIRYLLTGKKESYKMNNVYENDIQFNGEYCDLDSLTTTWCFSIDPRVVIPDISRSCNNSEFLLKISFSKYLDRFHLKQSDCLLEYSYTKFENKKQNHRIFEFVSKIDPGDFSQCCALANKNVKEVK